MRVCRKALSSYRWRFVSSASKARNISSDTARRSQESAEFSDAILCRINQSKNGWSAEQGQVVVVGLMTFLLESPKCQSRVPQVGVSSTQRDRSHQKSWGRPRRRDQIADVLDMRMPKMSCKLRSLLVRSMWGNVIYSHSNDVVEQCVVGGRHRASEIGVARLTHPSVAAP